MVAALISPWKSASEFWHHPNRLTRANRLSAERAPSRRKQPHKKNCAMHHPRP